MPAPPHGSRERVVRVFVSSTFDDMQAERDEMIKFVFPQLRKLCEQRFVTWGEVDLRWGITDEEKAEGRVLPICLEDIDRCRPYFIGFLGERYGGDSPEITAELSDRQPWLADQSAASLTELEILHGALNHPEAAKHAFFYFRSPAYVDQLPPEARKRYREEPRSSEIERFGFEEAERLCRQRKKRLASLKDRIRRRFPVRESYHDSEELGELVLKDLTSVVERLFPEEKVPDPLDREAAEHESFAAGRCRVYIGRREYYDTLDRHANDGGSPLVVLGDSGSGKSALLANWARRYRTGHPSDLVILHFIGASAVSADLTALLRRILGEIKRHYSLKDSVPQTLHELISAFPGWLAKAAAQGRTLLVLDGLNQLEDRGGSLELGWLPNSFPENVRLVTSTLPGRPLEEFSRREWPALTVEPLRRSERGRFIDDYLEIPRKKLGPGQRDRIAVTPRSRNPLFLRLLLDELCQIGEHGRLDEYLERYLAAADVGQLYSLILERLEVDYGRGRAGLSRDALKALWASRRGLSEQELREILGTEDGPLPQAHWSPLFLAMESALVNRSGLFSFGHDSLRHAVERRYLVEEEQRRQAHLGLADYFEPLRFLSERAVGELPWQLARAAAWARLYEVVSDTEFVGRLMGHDAYDATVFWRELKQEAGLDLVDAYRPVIDAPERHVVDAAEVAQFLDITGHAAEAGAIHALLSERYRKSGNRLRLAHSLGRLAGLAYQRGELDRAEELQKELYELYGQLEDARGQAGTLASRAEIAYLRGDYDAAEESIDRASELARRLADTDTEQAVLGIRGKILIVRGRFDEALELFEEFGRRALAEDNPAALSWALGNQGDILRRKGDPEGAMEYFRRAEALYEQHGSLSLLAAALGTQARVHQQEGRSGEALRLYERTEEIERDLGQLVGVAMTLIKKAHLIAARDGRSAGLAVAEEARSIIDRWGFDALRGELEEVESRLEFLPQPAPHRESDRSSKEDEMKCDVCSKTSSPKRGYILSTSQLVYDPGYWNRAFSLIPMPIEKLDSGLPGFIGQMASSETDWVVCEECMGSLSQDRAQPARYYADCVKTGRRPRLPDRGPASFVLAALNAGKAFEAKYGRKPESLQPS